VNLVVRPARKADIAAMSRVLIASITELCGADHGGQAERLAAWTANKTPEEVGAMLGRSGMSLFVGELDGQVAAVGAVTPKSGEVALNYVDPGMRFRGVSKALLLAMEAELQRHGVAEAHLTSTLTARAFYHAAGWRDDDSKVACQGGEGYRMRKRLQQTSS
jgi:GNAT superfamily N-acetyltransferase